MSGVRGAGRGMYNLYSGGHHAHGLSSSTTTTAPDASSSEANVILLQVTDTILNEVNKANTMHELIVNLANFLSDENEQINACFFSVLTHSSTTAIQDAIANKFFPEYGSTKFMPAAVNKLMLNKFINPYIEASDEFFQDFKATPTKEVIEQYNPKVLELPFLIALTVLPDEYLKDDQTKFIRFNITTHAGDKLSLPLLADFSEHKEHMLKEHPAAVRNMENLHELREELLEKYMDKVHNKEQHTSAHHVTHR